ncbi:MAG TPA: FtsX-like permease family protein, partial [Gemmataceae bacterium]
MAAVAPLIFLGVAAFLLNVVLSRLVQTQREQIAALKAFGYSNREVGWHYLQFVLALVALGVALGTLAGALLGRGLTELYTEFFHFPVFEYVLPARVVVQALGITLAASVLGTLAAIRRAVRLPPAEAMRPEPPARYRPSLVERWGLKQLFSPAARMIFRHLERHPLKSLLSILGIATAAAVLVLGNFMGDTIDWVMETQFHIAQRQDMTVTFVEPTSAQAYYDVANIPGVLRAEPFRSVPVRIRSAHRSRRLGVLGLPQNPELNRLIDVYRNPVELPPEGLVLSAVLAEVLRVRVGDAVTLEVLEGERPVREVPVVGTIDDFAGTAAYMDIRALHRLMREGGSLSGAFLLVDPARRGEVYRELKNTPQVAGVTVKDAVLTSFRETIAENLLRFRAFNVVFATIIAFGVVYNAARISLAERSRELATLRVIGFTRAEISLILLGELAVLTLAALPAGLVMGYGFAYLAATANRSELFRIPLVVSPSTYAFAATVVLLAALASGLVVRRSLDHLDLVAVLKAKE